jgi:hypothetical protein
MSDPFQAALVQFVKAIRDTFRVNVLRCEVFISEDPEHPMRFHLRELDRMLYHGELRQTPADVPPGKK